MSATHPTAGSTPTRSSEEVHPIVIVGGGLAGSAAAAFLARAGQPTVVLERHEHPTERPRAWVVSARSQELFHGLGLDEQIRTRGTAGGWDLQTVDTLTDASTRHTVEDETASISLTGTAMCDQDVMEDILRGYAADQGADIRWGTTATRIADRGDHVEVHVDGAAPLLARYAILADGARAGLLPDVGIGVTTPPDSDFEPFYQVLFRSPDLDELMADRPGKEFFCPPSSTIVFRRDLGRWQIQRQGHDFDDVDAALEAVAGRPIRAEVLDHGSWRPTGQHADRYRSGNVFLVGDAAHAMPPSLGMAGNLAIADAHNLAWKLAWVLTGRAGVGLLDSYEVERRPVDGLVLNQSLAGMHYQDTLDRVVLDLGLGYPGGTSSALDGEGDEATITDPRARQFVIGARVPDLRLHDGRSVLDLVEPDRFLLIGRGTSAAETATPVAVLPVEVDLDDECAWLVRPDGHIAAHLRLDHIGEVLAGILQPT